MHAAQHVHLLAQWSPAIGFITVFVTMFATVIAITKDLPDTAGDQAHGIQTFATTFGVRGVSLLGAPTGPCCRRSVGLPAG